jgi:hypothetical protein
VNRQEALAAHRALFRVDGEEVVPTELARGPWDPNALHGGPTAALLARAVERHDPGPATFVARLTVELFRPVTFAPLRIAVRTTRPGRNVQSLEASLFAGELEVARASALRIRETELEMPPAAAHATTPIAPETIELPPFADFDRIGFWTANDIAMVHGSWFDPGPGTAWLRLLCPVVEGEEPSPLQRVAAAADFGSGIGNPVRTLDVGAINPDLTIHLHRAAASEWIALDARAWAHGSGVGMAETVLFDEHGAIGRAVQSLIVQPFKFPFGGELRDRGKPD